MSRRGIKVMMVVSVAIGLSIAGVVLWQVFSAQAIPAAVRKQLTFSPLVYAGSGGYQVSDIKYDRIEKIFSFRLTSADGNSITVAEQSQPPQFAEVAEYKQRFLENVVKQYGSVQSSSGTVYLTRPANQSKQVGVIIDRGLLIFMSADKDLREDQWRQLAGYLELERI